MTIVQFALLVIGIYALTEIAGKFFIKKVEKPVLATLSGIVLMLLGLIFQWFPLFNAETIIEGLVAILAAQVLVDKFVNPILTSKKKA